MFYSVNILYILAALPKSA